jgi:hypothetical protein
VLYLDSSYGPSWPVIGRALPLTLHLQRVCRSVEQYIWYDIFVNCNWVAPGGSCTVHMYTQTIHRTTQNKQYIEQHKNFENNTKILEEFWKAVPFYRN